MSAKTQQHLASETQEERAVRLEKWVFFGKKRLA